MVVDIFYRQYINLEIDVGIVSVGWQMTGITLND